MGVDLVDVQEEVMDLLHHLLLHLLQQLLLLAALVEMVVAVDSPAVEMVVEVDSPQPAHLALLVLLLLEAVVAPVDVVHLEDLEVVLLVAPVDMVAVLQEDPVAALQEGQDMEDQALEDLAEFAKHGKRSNSNLKRL